MNCNTCEARFLCFTLPVDARPLRITVNWDTVKRCGSCVNVKWVRRKDYIARTGRGYGITAQNVGYCETAGMLVHRESVPCKNGYKPMKSFELEKLYKEISTEVGRKNRRGKLPKYCLLEE